MDKELRNKLIQKLNAIPKSAQEVTDSIGTII